LGPTGLVHRLRVDASMVVARQAGSVQNLLARFGFRRVPAARDRCEGQRHRRHAHRAPPPRGQPGLCPLAGILTFSTILPIPDFGGCVPSRVAAVLAVLFVSLVPGIAAAQTVPVTGVVTDPQGGVVVGATATLIPQAGARAVTTKTDAEGAFAFQ